MTLENMKNQRRNEILDVAMKLFFTQGYESTSTNQIVNAVGIARGTLYHHFKSKEEIMMGIIERQGQWIKFKAEAVLNDKSLPVLDRLIGILKAIKVTDDGGIMEHLHRPQNALLHQKVQEMMLEILLPIMTSLVYEGKKAGIFKTEFPQECMEMLLIYANTVFDHMSLSDSEIVERRVNGFIYHTERMLGMNDGSLLLLRDVLV